MVVAPSRARTYLTLDLDANKLPGPGDDGDTFRE